MSKKKERSRQELTAEQYDLESEREEMDRPGHFKSIDSMEDDETDVPDHNPNVDKSRTMKRKERDNIE